MSNTPALKLFGMMETASRNVQPVTGRHSKWGSYVRDSSIGPEVMSENHKFNSNSKNLVYVLI